MIAPSLVVVYRPYRRRLQIVELPAARGPGEGDDRHEDDHECERQHEEDDAHDALGSKVRPRHDAMSTVSELAGINRAAMSGVMIPVTASAAPTTL